MPYEVDFLLVDNFILLKWRDIYHVGDWGLSLLLLHLLILVENVLFLILFHHFLDSGHLRGFFRFNHVDCSKLIVDLVDDVVFSVFYWRRWGHLNYLVLTERVHDILEVQQVLVGRLGNLLRLIRSHKWQLRIRVILLEFDPVHVVV